MTKEIRYLLFSNEELYQALTASLRARDKPLPKGFLKSIRVGTTDKPQIALRYVSDNGAESTIAFEDQDVLSALIVYCRQNHIPLAAKATKALEIRGGAVGLFCTLNFKATKITTTDNKVSYGDEHSDAMTDKVMRTVASVSGELRAETPAKRGRNRR
jgi:hypothetical protein